MLEPRLEDCAPGGFDLPHAVFTKYKPVARKVNPVPGIIPDEFKNVRRFPHDPLEGLPSVPTHPPPFTAGFRLTDDRWNLIREDLVSKSKLLPAEIELVAHILKVNELGLAWEDSEKGQFRTDYFEPVKFPTIPHRPWTEKHLRIPLGLRDRLIAEIKRKIKMGVLEPSNSSYRARWFVVPKKDGGLRIVWNLEPLNAVTIRDAGVPPIIDETVEAFAGCTCYTLLDIYIGYDHRLIHPDYRDLTTVQTPVGPQRLTTLPMGYTNAVTIFHQDVCFIFQDEIPHLVQPFIDDVGIKGPKDFYLGQDGLPECLESNSGIRQFVYEHLIDFNRVLYRLRRAGGTFSAKKLQICVPEVTILGHCCNAYGRKPDLSHIKKILDWPPCKNLTQVRGFLGTMGLVRIFIKGYAELAWPLNSLTKKEIPFVWEEPQQTSMDDLKRAATTAPALKPIDYASILGVILAVDTSKIAVGYVIFQDDAEGKRHPCRYGSITLKEPESRYSQAKLELYGLMRSLKETRPFIISVTKLTVEMDAAYIKGMLNNPDEVPNATLNRWIAYIQLFTFELRHVSATEFKGPDGLSRRPATEEELTNAEDDIEDEIDRKLDSFSLTNCASQHSTTLCGKPLALATRSIFSMSEAPNSASIPSTMLGWSDASISLENCPIYAPILWLEESVSKHSPPTSWLEKFMAQEVPDTSSTSRGVYSLDSAAIGTIPRSDRSTTKDNNLLRIKSYLDLEPFNSSITSTQRKKIIQSSRLYFVRNKLLYRRDPNFRHQRVIFMDQRLSILKQVHDELGHRGFFPTRQLMRDRFWWPSINEDLRWYLKTCHECQTHNLFRLHIPPTVPEPAPLFTKAYGDTFFMEKAGGHKHVAHIRDSLSRWFEWRPLRKETGHTLGQFLFEEVLCRWGPLREIVTDNGTPWVKALDHLRDKYGIHHIRISPYNSQASGVVERQHRTIRESIVKACEGQIKRWLTVAAYCFWADRITTRQSTGHSPYYMAHGVEPVMPFDITEATYLVPELANPLTTDELIALRAKQLEKRDEELEIMRKRLWNARKMAAEEFNRRFGRSIKTYDIKPGDLVLVRNSAQEADLGRKWKPRYLGPYVVVSRSDHGNFTLAEMDGSVSKLKFAAKRVIPYHIRESDEIPLPNESLDHANPND